MPGRMSIDWLLNEDEQQETEQQENTPQLVVPGSQSQEGRWIDGQELPGACTDTHTTATTTDNVFHQVNQPRYESGHPKLTVRQHRGSSTANRTGATSKSTQPRAPRPKYSAEEDHFIWYQRIDLGKDWREVSHAFNEHFRDRHRDGESGLQCRFYRILDAAGVPNVRSLRGSNDRERIAQFGLVAQTRYRYSWMLPRHRLA